MEKTLTVLVEQPQKKLCGHVIRCWDFLRRPCIREAGHDPLEGHNPFSNSYPSSNQMFSNKRAIA
jgi:hypothetical protein